MTSMAVVLISRRTQTFPPLTGVEGKAPPPTAISLNTDLFSTSSPSTVPSEDTVPANPTDIPPTHTIAGTLSTPAECPDFLTRDQKSLPPPTTPKSDPPVQLPTTPTNIVARTPFPYRKIKTRVASPPPPTIAEKLNTLEHISSPSLIHSTLTRMYANKK